MELTFEVTLVYDDVDDGVPTPAEEDVVEALSELSRIAGLPAPDAVNVVRL